jgi:hypothetical protein
VTQINYDMRHFYFRVAILVLTTLPYHLLEAGHLCTFMVQYLKLQYVFGVILLLHGKFLGISLASLSAV